MKAIHLGSRGLIELDTGHVVLVEAGADTMALATWLRLHLFEIQYCERDREGAAAGSPAGCCQSFVTDAIGDRWGPRKLCPLC